MPRPSKDDATFDGPLRVLVAGGLAYMLWLALRPKAATAAALPASVDTAPLP